MFVVATIQDLEVYQMDVKTTFLNGNLSKKIYMQQLEGFMIKGENMVFKLLKSLYGLKHSACVWNHKIDAYFLFAKFENNYVDHIVYFKRA